MPASRRPPGAPRRGSRIHRAVPIPPPVDRMDTTPLDMGELRAAPVPGVTPAQSGGPSTTPLPTAGPATAPLPPQSSTAAGIPPQGSPAGMPPHGSTAAGVPPQGSPAVGAHRVTVTRVAAARSRELTVAAVRRVQAASRADGAGETGLAQLLWVNALHTAGDAMIAVSLAGTLFFAAASGAQRGNVALYLLVTMAPFAVLAPVIGPVLDRLQRGRRWAIAFCMLGRAVLALVMAGHFHDLGLYPAALGTLVLSKALGVLRAAVVPRVLPARLSLTSANSRLSVFGLVTAGVFGAVAAGAAKAFGFSTELWLTAAVFVVGGVLAFRLPRHVDVPAGEQPAPALVTGPSPTGRWRRRAVRHSVSTALRANAVLRGLSGFLTIFSAFLVEATVPGGWQATLALGGIAAAAGLGSILGTAAGSRLRTATPDTIVLVAAGVAAGITVLVAVFYSLAMAAVVAGAAAVTSSLAKVALDAIIQRDVPEAQRASAFARSETLLQLAWVVGGAFGIALPPTGWLGFTVAAGLLVLAFALVLWGRSRRGRAEVAAEPGPEAPTTPLGPSWS